jgi:murein DD-endopeptidase MepM/ murein hydrolase activator NlpD
VLTAVSEQTDARTPTNSHGHRERFSPLQGIDIVDMDVLQRRHARIRCKQFGFADMVRIKYYYDAKTGTYQRCSTRRHHTILHSLAFVVLSVSMAVGMLALYGQYFESPKELILNNQIKELEFYYQKLNKDVDVINSILENVELRDDKIYRIVLGAEPIEKTVRDVGIGGTDRYAEVREKNLSHSDLVIDLYERIDRTRRKLYIESKSQDELVQIAETKAKLYSAIPAIQPVANKDLKSLSSGFGIRIHPIHKKKKMHHGIDFSASIGTPIYATADGKVTRVEVKSTGYGKSVDIDHAFGYRTRYAHMLNFGVKKGQTVKRGDLIGYVGSSGSSTAAHLHYEVFINNKRVDPVHYFFNDLTAAEYEKILELASIENESLDMQY